VMKGSLTATSSTSSLWRATLATKRPILPNPFTFHRNKFQKKKAKTKKWKRCWTDMKEEKGEERMKMMYRWFRSWPCLIHAIHWKRKGKRNRKKKKVRNGKQLKTKRREKKRKNGEKCDGYLHTHNWWR